MVREALFIVNSPFQAICALEAISSFGIQKPDFIILSDVSSKKQVSSLLDGKGNVIFFNHTNQGTLSLLKSAISLEIKSSQIFIGDFFSYSQFVIGVICAKCQSNIYYMDDGNSTLTIFPPISRKRYNSLTNRFVFLLFSSLAKIKMLNEKFFSIYDIPVCEGKLIKNKFISLAGTTCNSTLSGIYIIGTNSSQIRVKGGYPKLLTDCVLHLKERFPKEPVFYCPHRRDTNKYDELLSNLEVDVFNTEISVEVDFYRKGINPVAVAGFGSTALMSLNLMYPSAACMSFSFKPISEDAEKSYEYILNYFKQCGIEIV